MFKHEQQPQQGNGANAAGTTTTTHHHSIFHHGEHAQQQTTQPHGAPAPPPASTGVIGGLLGHSQAPQHHAINAPHGSLLPAQPHVHSELTKEIVQAAGELIGTFFFLFVGFGAIQANASQSEHSLVPNSIAFGLALTTAVFLTYRISGGALNPAVVFGLFILGKIPARKAGLYVAGELVGASLAALAVAVVFPNSWGAHFKGNNEVFAPASYIQAVFLEAILTSGLILVVLFLAVEKSKATFLAPVFIGLYVFIAHIVSIPYTNTSLNPARSFGTAIVTLQFGAQWVFWVGPLLGSVFAAGVYKFFKHFDYEQLNIGQEDDHAQAQIRI